MRKILDKSYDTSIAEAIMECLDDLGFSPEEAIPGMIQTVFLLAEKTGDPEEALDEAADMLADGPEKDT